MNRIYRLVWDQVRHAWTVASELARRGGKRGRGRVGSVRRAGVAQRVAWLSMVLLALPTAAMAASPSPVGRIRPQVVIRQAGVPEIAMEIPMSGYALPTGGTITGGQGSIDYGEHSATITQDSERLSLNWLTFNIGAQDTVDFLQPDAQAIAVNRIADPNGSSILGHLNANGRVFLINPNGVLFGAGAQVDVGALVASTLDIDDASLTSGDWRFNGDGSGSIVNRGTITATGGGYIALLGNTVSNQGTLRADGGAVALGAGSEVTLHLDGDRLVGMQVDASALNALAENKQLIVADGGQVLMSAGARDSLLASVVNNSGVIQAQTVGNRNGRIVLLGGMAAGTTQVGGTLDASAPSGGDGGFVETSAAHAKVADDAHVTTAAAHGTTGRWLIDPQDYIIAASGGDMTGAALSSALGSTDVEIQSSAGGVAGSGDINVDDAVSWSANTVLTLTASNDVNINADLTATGANAGLMLAPSTANGSEAASGAGEYILDHGTSITLSGASPSLSIAGIAYTVINSLGIEGDTSATTLQGMAGDLAGHYALGTNIDASATAGWNDNGDGTFAGFDPIGTFPTLATPMPFTGVFDGLGHTIADLTIDRPATSLAGLFGYADNGSMIRNVGVLGGSVTGESSVGGLVGYNGSGTITQAYATAAVSSTGSDVGGLIGTNAGAITLAYATGAVSATGSEIGGLIGYNGGTITQAYATGAVNGGNDNVGGLIGYNGGTIYQAYATGAVGSTGSDTGGLVGTNYAYGTITQAYATGAVSSTSILVEGVLFGGDTVGGLVGNNGLGGAITQAYATGAVSGTEQIGGLVGYDAGTIIQANATGAVSGTSTYVGGLVGYHSSGTITQAYATGAVSGTEQIGGLVGYNYSGTITQVYATGAVSGATDVGGLIGYNGLGAITNGYWDTETSGSASGIANDNNGQTVAGLTTVELTTARPTGFDTAAWDNGDDRTTPYLLGLAGNQVFNRNDLPAGTISTTNLPNLYTVIQDVDQLQAIDSGDLGGHYLLGNDIDASTTVSWNAGLGFDPIGDDSTPFTGVFDGLGHTIDDLSIDRPSTDSVGLFGHTSGSAIRNVGLLGGSVAGNSNVGGLVGFNGGTITQAYTTGAIHGIWYVGGLVGYNYIHATITQAYATGAIDGTYDVGGLVGENLFSTITHSYATGAVSGDSDIGGLVGSNNQSTITQAYAIGAVSGADDIGGLIGYDHRGTISQVYATGAVSTSFLAAGGLIGYEEFGTITQAYASGAVDGVDDVGGLLGVNEGTVTQAYATGAVTGDSDLGGLVGFHSSGTIADSYWDTQTTGQDASSGSAASFGLTTAELEAALPTGFDAAAWGNADNHSTPFLKDNVGTVWIDSDATDTRYSLIFDIDQLQAIDSGDLAGHYALANDIDASATAGWNGGLGFDPISGSAIIIPFTGVFDGLGHTINDLFIDRPTTDYVGLFGYAQHSTIRNLGLLGGSVRGYNSVGGLVGGIDSGTITRVYTTGAVSGVFGDSGGLVGNNSGTISNAYATGAVSGGGDIGGLVGNNYGTISNAYATGAVSGDYEIGGLVGFNLGTISQVYATGNVSGSSVVGALVGFNNGDLSNAYRDTAEQPSLQDIGIDSNGQTVYGLTTAELEAALPSGFDDNVWGNADNRSTPYLIDNVGTVWIDTDATDTRYNLIFDIDQLQAIDSGDLAGHYALANDIDASATATWNDNGGGTFAGFDPIGGNANKFIGVFDGLGHTIADLTIDRPSTDYVGLFGYIDAGSAIRNVGLLGGSVTGLSYVGGLAGFNNDGTVIQAYATDAVSGYLTVGGLVGHNDGTIAQAYATGTVSGHFTAGGLVGDNYGAITQAYATGAVSGNDEVGGLAGLNTSGTITQVYATGAVTGDSNVGGLAGRNTIGTITDGYWDTQTTGQATSAGSGATGLTTTDMMDPASFIGWDIATVGGSASVWRVYEGHTAPLLRAFMTSLALSSDDVSRVYNGSDQTSSSYSYGTLTPSLWLPSASVDASLILGSAGASAGARNVGAYALDAGPYSGQLGYDINYTLGTLTITKLAVTVAATGTDRTYDGTTGDAVSLASTGILGADDISFTGSGAFADKNVGEDKDVSVTGIAASGTDAGNYSYAATASTTADITKLAVTVDATGADRVYDGTTGDAVSLASTGILGADDISFAGTGAFADKNVGDGKAVSVTGISASGDDAGNYSYAATASTTADITKLAVTVAAIGTDRVYDGALADSVSLASTGILGADDISFAGTGAFADKNVGDGRTVSVTGISASGDDAGNYSYAATAATTADITKLAVTVDATGTDRTYDGTTGDAVSLASTGTLGADDISFAGTGAFADKNVGDGKAVSVTGISASGTDAGNYSFNTTASTSADITKLGITVDATGTDRVYDGTTVDTVNLGSGGIIGDDDVAFDGSGAFGDKKVGEDNPVSVTGITASGSDAGNYSFNTTGNTTADISKLAITVDAAGTDKTYDGNTIDSVTLGSDGVIDGDDVSFTGSSAFEDKNAGAGKTVDVTGIGASGIDAGNYSWNASATATADIAKLAVTVDATGTNKTYDGTTADVVALGSDGVIDGDDVSFTGVGLFADKQAGEDKAVTVTGIAASGADAGNYSFDSTATTFADIAKLAVTVDATGTDRIYDGTTADAVSLSSDDILAGDSLSFTGSGAFADKNAGGDKSVAVTGIDASGADAGNYTWNASAGASASADIDRAALSAGLTGDLDKVYDGTPDAVLASSQYVLAGFVAGEDATVTETAGAYDSRNVTDTTHVTATLDADDFAAADGTDLANYVLPVSASGTAHITPLVITVDAIGTDRTYDGTTADAVVLASAGILAGDSVSFIGSGAFADKHVGEDKAVSVTGISASGDDAGNYSYDTTTSTTADIDPATLTYTATHVATSTGILPALGGTVSGFVGGDTLADATGGTLTWTTPADAYSPHGNYAIEGGGLTATNYAFVQAPGNADALVLRPNLAPQTVSDAIASVFQQAFPWPSWYFPQSTDNDNTTGDGTGDSDAFAAHVQIVDGGIRLPSPPEGP